MEKIMKTIANCTYHRFPCILKHTHTIHLRRPIRIFCSCFRTWKETQKIRIQDVHKHYFTTSDRLYENCNMTREKKNLIDFHDSIFVLSLSQKACKQISYCADISHWYDHIALRQSKVISLEFMSLCQLLRLTRLIFDCWFLIWNYLQQATPKKSSKKNLYPAVFECNKTASSLCVFAIKRELHKKIWLANILVKSPYFQSTHKLTEWYTHTHTHQPPGL